MHIMTNHLAIDGPSLDGKFGWEKIGSEGLAIPVILRSNNVRYSPVRVVEQEIIKKFEGLPHGVFQCITLKSFYLTTTESKLMNVINYNHCNNHYGESLFSTKDVIISATDTKDLLRFLNVSHKIFTEDLHKFKERFGLIKLQINPQAPELRLSVPYLGKSHPRSKHPGRFVPLKLIEAYISQNSIKVEGAPTDWDIMYLKMLAIYSGNNAVNHITRDCNIALLDDLTYALTGLPLVYEDCFRGNRS